MNQPVLLTHHLRKGRRMDWEGGVGLERVRGTGRIAQAARVVWRLDTPYRAKKNLNIQSHRLLNRTWSLP